ncbi:alpha/beta hydrolase [Pseudomonas sp. RTC3]|uniref:alpha/beta hydrolase n=2 Tax=unclassified Pseudomonas TaxID=196821 RepID=UPI002AB351ED|nr:alpha/beta hydrolase [Pseudomonas sp. 5C2]MDY7566666.1 alpha/beta hydrolase [Pseudomonas sp. 5C2]MEB0061559.1 alpha/beta hydrolase [Pseudomonas sp. RTC3]MEB0240639.1 alpha/beta hydrolase [Pseudomonas sp. 5C2]
MITKHRKLVIALSAIGVVTFLSLSGCVRDPDKPSVSQLAVSGTKSMLRTDSDMHKVLNKFASFDGKAVEKITPTEARQQPTMADAVKGVLADQKRDSTPTTLVPGVTTREIQVPGAAGSMPATVYTPDGTGPFPVVLYFHGGGWVFADRKVYDGGARGLAKQANAVVVSVDYRLAPENKFPAAHEDALAAYRWLTTKASSVNGDPKRLALAGESAGGNLAVATAVAAHKAGLTAPKHVLSVYPVAQSNTDTESYLKYADAIPLNRPMMLWFISQVITSQADAKDPRIDLVHANLQGLPPVTLINAEIDPLRDDGAQLEQALRSAGVSVERRLYPGVTHEFFGTAAVVQKAQEAQIYAGERLKVDLEK